MKVHKSEDRSESVDWFAPVSFVSGVLSLLCLSPFAALIGSGVQGPADGFYPFLLAAPILALAGCLTALLSLLSANGKRYVIIALFGLAVSVAAAIGFVAIVISILNKVTM